MATQTTSLRLKERLFYPPNSFTGSDHWVVQTLRVDGSYRTYTEHQTKAAAVEQLGRMVARYPSHQLRLVEVKA